MSQPTCGCSGGPKLVFACSGAADVGEIADRAARKLNREGMGKMFCMAGLGGRIGGILKTTESAQAILAIDGCPLNCVKSSLEQAGFKRFKHLQLVDLGLEKCKSPVTEESVNKVAARAAELICS
jgi:uncharacterized metal-binding protein